MEPNRVSFRDGRLASRKAEEAALRRYEAANFLDNMVGPTCLSNKPSEQEFVSCLRNGLILCNTINKIEPGSVPKVVSNPSVRATLLDNQPLPAYQYFENIRNFLVAVEELKLPSFEASDLDRDNLDIGSVTRIVDCILSLKSYNEYKQKGEINKCIKSPIFAQGNLCLTPSISFIHKKRLDMNSESDNNNNKKSNQSENIKNGEDIDAIVKLLTDSMINSKENINQKFIDISSEEKMDPVMLLRNIITSCMDKQTVHDFPIKGNILNDISELHNKDKNLSLQKFSVLEAQEREIKELREMLKGVKMDFESLQNQAQNDYKNLVHEMQGLSIAASKYNEAIKENRNLYNMLQELKGNIRVFCRVRPLTNSQSKSTIEHIGDDGSLMVFDPLKPQSTRKVFQFNQIFGPNATQGDVYKETQSLIRSIVDGYNVCIFAYGQTGSGKTHTMCGPTGGALKDNGINYLALNDLFYISSNRGDMKYKIQVQMVEIYNEQVRDLLAEDSSSTKLEIRTCTNEGQMSLPEAKLMKVGSTDDVINLMKLGERNRASGSTAMNNRSSRSHSILIVHVHGEDPTTKSTVNSNLYLVDLAGSERVDRSEASGDRLKEAQHINKSLSCLGDVIMALAQKSPHVPYRNSKLTQLLQKSLGGNAKMLMFAHVSPETDSYSETVGTLKFAQRAATVELGAAHANNKESSEVKDLKEQIESLKKALAAKETERKTKEKANFPNSESLPKTATNLDKTPPRYRRMSLETPINARSAIMQKSPINSRSVIMQKSPTPINARSAIMQKSPINSRSVIMQKSPISSKPPLVAESPNCAASQLNRRFYSETTKDKSLHRSFVADSCHEFSSNNYKIKSQLREPIMMNGQDAFSFSSGASSSSSSVHKKTAVNKGSNIRKSIQSLGKLINGSDKRCNQIETPVSRNLGKRYNPSEKTPVNSSAKKISTNLDAKTPVISSDARSSRRQSLTNLPAGPNFTHRSSLGGKSDSCK